MERPEMVGKVAMILQIPEAQLTQPVEPGDTLRVEAEVLKLGERLGELRGAIYRGDEKVAEGKCGLPSLKRRKSGVRSQASGVKMQNEPRGRESTVKAGCRSSLQVAWTFSCRPGFGLILPS